MKKTAKLFAAAAILAAIAFGMAGCNLATSGFGTITIPGLPEPPEPPPPLPPPPPSFSLENQQYNDYWEWVVTDDDTVIIVGYRGNAAHVDIPASLDGLPVAAIARPSAMSGDVEIPMLPPVFRNSNLSSVSIPHGVVVIGAAAFTGRQLTRVDIPDSVTSIGVSAFERNQLTRVDIPGSVTSIGQFAFSQNHLAEVVIPYGVISIGRSAFSTQGGHGGENLPLRSVTIAESVTSIGRGAFGMNNSPGGGTAAENTNGELVSVTFLGTIPTENIGEAAFNVGVHWWACAFNGNLREQFALGGPGTYTRAPRGAHWTRQN
ncbi:MAG: leucine-rich repeat domain-containing protein [Spirochaetes bacterium]|nr:leucine-rich repeat domain-containing protein [Spirochaetota bacterium]